MRIVDIDGRDEVVVQRAAALLVEGFRELSPNAWPDLDAALDEMSEACQADRIARAAVDEAGTVVGWIGGISQYDGRVWEIHPLVVSPAHQRTGIGRMLVADLESIVRERGALTLWLGTDDESNRTTLSGIDLYPDVCQHIATIRNLRGHPYGFYQRLGFVIVGVIPDANGFGKPDIFMAKRVQGSPLRAPSSGP